MPNKTEKQHKFMLAVKHNPKFAKKVGVDQEVGKEMVDKTPKGKFDKIKKLVSG